MSGLTELPSDLPVPTDDGGADHLKGMSLPSIALASTMGNAIDPSKHETEWLVLYVYPMTGRPDRDLPDGWEQIPGARGCTPQSCAFRDHKDALARLGAQVMGLSVQDAEYQAEMATRLHLGYPVLSDSDRKFATAMKLPTMTVEMAAGEHVELYKRLTMIVRRGLVKHVMYPVFPPDENAANVEEWLSK